MFDCMCNIGGFMIRLHLIKLFFCCCNKH